MKVNVTINHKQNSTDGGEDNSQERGDVSFELYRKNGQLWEPTGKTVELTPQDCDGYTHNLSQSDFTTT